MGEIKAIHALVTGVFLLTTPVSPRQDVPWEQGCGGLHEPKAAAVRFSLVLLAGDICQAQLAASPPRDVGCDARRRRHVSSAACCVQAHTERGRRVLLK